MLEFDKSKLVSEKTNGVITLKYDDSDAYKNGTDITFKALKEVDDYRAEYLKAVTEFAVEQAKDELQKDKTLEKAIVQFPFTTSKRGEANVIVDRSKTYPGMNGGDDVTKSKVTVVVKDPNDIVSKSFIKVLEKDLTNLLIKS